MKDSYTYYKDKLNTEYKEAFEQVELYVFTQYVNESLREERLSDILDSFLSAQEKEKPVQKITGSNMERFCKTFCSDFGIKNRILNILDWLKFIAWVIFIVSMVDIVFSLWEGPNLWRPLFFANYLIVIFIGWVAMTLTNYILFCRSMFKTKKVSIQTYNIVILVEALALGAGSFLILKNVVPSFLEPPLWAVALFSCLYLAIYYSLLGKRLKRP